MSFCQSSFAYFKKKTIIFCHFGSSIMNGFEGDRTQKKTKLSEDKKEAS